MATKKQNTVLSANGKNALEKTAERRATTVLDCVEAIGQNLSINMTVFLSRLYVVLAFFGIDIPNDDATDDEIADAFRKAATGHERREKRRSNRNAERGQFARLGVNR